MHKKILWYARKHPERSLSYSLLVACIYADGCDPKPFYDSDTVTDFATFCKDCSRPNMFNDNDGNMAFQFKSDTGVDVSDLISSEIWREIIEMDSVNDYIAAKTFESQNEIRDLCRKIYREYLNEPCFLNDKKIVQMYGQRGLVFSTQMRNLGRNIDVMEKWVDGTTNQYWFGVNAVNCITRRFEKLMAVEQTPAAWRNAILGLKDAFHFTDLQIEMLRYFICQTKEYNCPASLNKALYFWGKGKGTGKTTIAATIVSILNGEKDHFNIRNYKSTLAQELQFQTFVAPMICSCRAVLLDEAMPKDSSKSYDTLKERITADGAKVRFIHKNQVDLAAKANYVFGSNHPLSYFVQDESERRFLEFHIEKKFKELTYSEIYNLFLHFIQQCKREKDWQVWYDEMAKDTEVKGLESRNINDIRSYFQIPGFKVAVENCGAQVSVGTFYKWVAEFEKNVSKQSILECVIDTFGVEYRPSLWKRTDILATLAKIKGETDD